MTMRNSTLDQRNRQRRFRDPAAKLSLAWIDPAWHTRAVYEATAVRRILRSAHAGGNGVFGIAATMGALELNLTRHLLITERFVESNPRLALLVQLAVDAGKLTTQTISGAAALELDLVGEGIGAVLARRHGRPSAHRNGGRRTNWEDDLC